MRFIPEDLLSALIETAPRPTAHAPRDARGLYGLVDHHGDLRYIGSTSSTDQTFYERIHQRHRTGTEGMSHYFSQMYNTGRMWRERKDATTKVDGDLSKKLRNEFVVKDVFHVANIKLAVGNFVTFGVFFCIKNSFRNCFHTYDFFGLFGNKLGNRSCSGIQIINDFISS